MQPIVPDKAIFVVIVGTNEGTTAGHIYKAPDNVLLSNEKCRYFFYFFFMKTDVAGSIRSTSTRHF